MHFRFIRRIGKRIIPIRWLEWLVLWKTILFDSDSVGMKGVEFLKRFDHVLVLGTGPSLSKDMDRILELSKSADVICVNNFCLNKQYTLLKPGKYVFLDQYFFARDAHPDWVKQRKETFEAIDRLTTWSMQVFIPKWVDRSEIRRQIPNPNVSIVALKVFPYHCRSKHRLFKKFDSGYYGPYQCNVLNQAILVAIWSGYREIRLFGCDLSLHLDIEVDQESNLVNIRYRYFGRPDRVERFMKNPQKAQPLDMAAIMMTTARTFIAHDVLNEYATHRGAKIYNCAAFSLIDAYERERSADTLQSRHD